MTLEDSTPPHVCITCADELLRFIVSAVDAGSVATGTVDGVPAVVNVELIDDVRSGDVLLCHGGVALQRDGAAEVGA